MVPEGEAARLSARVHFTVNQTATVIGSHVKSVYMASGVGLLAAADTSGKLFIDWQVNQFLPFSIFDIACSPLARPSTQRPRWL